VYMFPTIKLISLESLRESQRYDLIDHVKTIEEYIRCCTTELDELVRWQSDREPEHYAARRNYLSRALLCEIREAERHVKTSGLRMQQLQRVDVIPVLPKFPPHNPRTIHTPMKRKRGLVNVGGSVSGRRYPPD
jgi:hypothetical protein